MVTMSAIGPVLGGTFSDPERQFPGTLGRIQLLQKYPYALPCLISGVYIAIAFVLNLFYLKEPAHREQAAKEPLRKLFNATLAKVMLIFAFAMFLGLAYSTFLVAFLISITTDKLLNPSCYTTSVCIYTS
jgi:hypothetical protein